MKLKIASAAVALSLLGGCIIIDADDDNFRTSFDGAHSGYGTVFGADVSANSVAFLVTSNGCTERGFFDVDVKKEDDNAFEIGVRRIRQDHCEAVVPNGVEVVWTYAELGILEGAEVSVRNQVRR